MQTFGNFCLYFTDLYQHNDLNTSYFTVCDASETETEKSEKEFTEFFYPGITGWTHRIWSLNFLLKGLNQVM